VTLHFGTRFRNERDRRSSGHLGYELANQRSPCTCHRRLMAQGRHTASSKSSFSNPLPASPGDGESALGCSSQRPGRLTASHVSMGDGTQGCRKCDEKAVTTRIRRVQWCQRRSTQAKLASYGLLRTPAKLATAPADTLSRNEFEGRPRLQKGGPTKVSRRRPAISPLPLGVHDQKEAQPPAEPQGGKSEFPPCQPRTATPCLTFTGTRTEYSVINNQASGEYPDLPIVRL
jgi:hypothetical protein